MDYFEGKLEPKEKEQIMIALCKLIFKVSPSFKKKKKSEVCKTDECRTVCQYNPTSASVTIVRLTTIEK